MKWISIKDKLPELPCIAFWDDNRYTLLNIDCNIEYAVKWHPLDANVTHWMPLPEPPA